MQPAKVVARSYRGEIVSNMHHFPGADDLFRRQTIELDLPRFLIRIFENEVAKANVGAPEDECLTLNNYLEYHLAEFVSLSDVLELEKEVPGIAKAVWTWLEESNA